MIDDGYFYSSMYIFWATGLRRTLAISLRIRAGKEKIQGQGVRQAVQYCIEYRIKRMFAILSNAFVAMYLVEC